MSEKKVVVPEGMLMAAMAVKIGFSQGYESFTRRILEAALLWLSDGHMPLLLPMLVAVKDAVPGWSVNETVVQGILHQGLRRMFLAPEPAAPEAIKDLLYGMSESGSGEVNERLAEAYRRGQKSVEMERVEVFERAYGRER